MNFHGGNGLGVNWYTVRAKNEKDLVDRIQNVFIYITPTHIPREAETLTGDYGTIFLNGAYNDRDDASSYQRIVRCTSAECDHAHMYSRVDGFKVRPAWVYDLHLSDQVMREGAPTQHIRVNVRRDEFSEE